MKQTKTQNRKKGLTIVEASLVILASIVAIIVAIKGYGEVTYRLKKTLLTRQVSEINSGADAWKGMRSNFTGLSMTVLCAEGQQSVSESTCGGVGGRGSQSNAYGGDFTIEAGSNLSEKSLEISDLPVERVAELADSLAPLTINECESSDDCDSISVSGTTITLTL